MPAETLVVERVTTIGVPSVVEVQFVETAYVAEAALDVSLICVEADAPPAVTVKDSVPSVKLSLASKTEIVACRLLPTVVVPLIEPDARSVLLMPEIVYGTTVPGATLVVVKVNEATEPSFTFVVFALNE